MEQRSINLIERDTSSGSSLCLQISVTLRSHKSSTDNVTYLHEFNQCFGEPRIDEQLSCRFRQIQDVVYASQGQVASGWRDIRRLKRAVTDNGDTLGQDSAIVLTGASCEVEKLFECRITLRSHHCLELLQDIPHSPLASVGSVVQEAVDVEKSKSGVAITLCPRPTLSVLFRQAVSASRDANLDFGSGKNGCDRSGRRLQPQCLR